MNISLHIERLVLDGLPVSAAQAPLVQAAVEAELMRWLASQPIAPASSTALASVTAGDIQTRPSAPARELGGAIGRSIFRSLTQTTNKGK